MDFSKFVALLKDRALYFARADRLGDQFEGARGLASKKAEWDEYRLAYYRKLIRNPPSGPTNPLEDVVEREAERLLKEDDEFGRRDILATYVSCWHENTVESEALWRLYCPPYSAGVAIRTDSTRLNESLGDDPEIKFGRVRYVDFAKGFAGTYDRIFWKRKSLSHESEVRGVKQRYGGSEEHGILTPVNLSILISMVVISPFSPPWFEAVLKETLARFGVQAPVTKSEITGQPFF